MATKHFIVATAGHVDHGKSSLVKALTGIDPDRLPEEKARGITIDLGFAHLELTGVGAGEAPATFSCGVIDVPGHEDFVKNMVAGVGSIDLALLVVAADDGWMPQTEEHLQILLYLGVDRAVVALTKADLATNESQVIDAIRTRLLGTPFARAAIVPTSVPSGRGFDELKAAIARELSEAPVPPDIGKPRLWVDRAFTLKGLGTVVTGTLSGGFLARGDAVTVQPTGQPTRIRSCQSHGRDTDRVGPGTRVALNLPDVAVAGNGSDTGAIRRGDMVTTEAMGCPTATLDVSLVKSPRLEAMNLAAARPLKNGSRVRIHLGSADVAARVRLLRDDALAPGQRGPAQLRLERPVLAFAGDHFILRDSSQEATIAGGVILDPDARRNRDRSPGRLASLEACAANLSRPDPFVLATLHQRAPMPVMDLLVRSRFARREVISAIGRLVAAGHVVLAGPWVASAGVWNELVRIATERIDAYHRQHPEKHGLPLSDLRSVFQGPQGWTTVFDEFVAALTRSGFVTHGTVICRGAHQPALPPNLAGPGQRIRDTLAQHPLDPPSRKELAPDGPGLQALRFLVQSGEVVELGPETALAAGAFTAARERVRSFLVQRGQASASELRQMLGTSRRILIPLLEKLDREGVTVREGDLRRLRK